MKHTVPKYLYKYRPVDANALAMLASDKLFLSPLDAFNDPFEALDWNPTLETRITAQRQGTFAVSEPPIQAPNSGVALRACSLSEESQDLLMWGHYADRHCGFCIRFEFANDAELSELLHPVRYEPKIPDVDPDNGRNGDDLLLAVLTKSDKWSYEREWRIIGQMSPAESDASELFATYKQDAITGILFGVRTPELHKSLIRKVLHDRRLEYYQAEKQNDNFVLRIRALND
jgi:hypothetical protein